MALPTTRAEFSDYCLRKLGDGAITINVTTDQIADRIDEALEHFYEYHDEGTERVLLEYTISGADLANHYIVMPENVIGIEGFLESPGNASSASPYWNVEYQYWLANAYEIAGTNMRYFYVAMMHLENLYQMFDVHTAIRYNRVTNRLYIEDDWTKFTVGEKFIFDAAVTIPESGFPRLWQNKWLRDYSTALIKKQWGENLSKFDQVQMIGGVVFNGQRLIDEANTDIEVLETQVKETETAPLGIFIG